MESKRNSVGRAGRAASTRRGAKSAGLDVLVWYAEPIDAPWVEPLLDECDRSRRDALHGDDRARFVTGRLLARHLTAQHAGVAADDVALRVRCPRCGRGHGKPRVAGAGADLELSIAHSHRRVLVAAAVGVPVGVDVEAVERVRTSTALARQALSAAELAVFAAMAPTDRSRTLRTYWVRKEALLKATGQGLVVPLSSLTMSRPEQPPRLLGWESEAEAPALVCMADVTVGPEYVACVAGLTDGPLRLTIMDAGTRLRASSVAPDPSG